MTEYLDTYIHAYLTAVGPPSSGFQTVILLGATCADG